MQESRDVVRPICRRVRHIGDLGLVGTESHPRRGEWSSRCSPLPRPRARALGPLAGCRPPCPARRARRRARLPRSRCRRAVGSSRWLGPGRQPCRSWIWNVASCEAPGRYGLLDRRCPMQRTCHVPRLYRAPSSPRDCNSSACAVEFVAGRSTSSRTPARLQRRRRARWPSTRCSSTSEGPTAPSRPMRDDASDTDERGEHDRHAKELEDSGAMVAAFALKPQRDGYLDSARPRHRWTVPRGQGGHRRLRHPRGTRPRRGPRAGA